MVKTHRITGLKYLCQTTKKDPYKYKGSGLYWVKHLKKHGANFDTNIILKCYTKSALKEWGLYYSKLWSIVQSKHWANMIPEGGEGNPEFSQEIIEKLRTKSLNHWSNSNSKFHSVERNEKISKSMKKLWNETTSVFNSQEFHNKKSEKTKKSWMNINSGQHKSKKKYVVIDPAGLKYEVLGMSTFCKKHGLDRRSMLSVVKGKRPHHKGWTANPVGVDKR